MALKSNVKEAVVSLYAAKQRSFLALVGIVIGIGSVIAMLSVGTIAKHQSLDRFRELGTDYLTIQVRGGAGGGGARAGVRLEDAVGLPDGTASIAGAAPWSQGYTAIVHGGKKIADAPALGVTGAFLDLNRLKLAAGRGISDLDFRRAHCVIGAKIAGSLRRAGVKDAIGEPIRLNDRICTVVGVLRTAPRWGMQPFEADRTVLIPVSTAQRLFPRHRLNRIVARMAPEVHHNRGHQGGAGVFPEQGAAPVGQRAERAASDRADAAPDPDLRSAAGRDRQYFTDRRRGRSDERDAGLGNRAAQGDRDQAGAGGAPLRHPEPVPDRVGGAFPDVGGTGAATERRRAPQARRYPCPDPADGPVTRFYQCLAPDPAHPNRTAMEQVRA